MTIYFHFQNKLSRYDSLFTTFRLLLFFHLLATSSKVFFLLYYIPPTTPPPHFRRIVWMYESHNIVSSLKVHSQRPVFRERTRNSDWLFFLPPASFSFPRKPSGCVLDKSCDFVSKFITNMHETSPGVVEEHELSIRSDNKSELNGANSKINTDMEFENVKNENIDESDAEQRIYDDPCELMDDVPIFNLPKSRSWFCCPSADAFCVPASSSAMVAATGQTNIFYNRYPDYSLVTEAPRTQYQTVCWLVKKRRGNSIFLINFPPTAALNWIYDIIRGATHNVCYAFSHKCFPSIFRYKL